MDLALAVVGSPIRLQQLLGHAFKLTLAALGQVAALGPGRGILIEEGGNLQLVPDALGNALRQIDALLQGHVHRGDEGDDVGRAHAGMLTHVLVHVDQLGGLLAELEGNLLDALRGADHREHAAVVAAVGLNVHQGHARGGLCHVHELIEDDGIDFLADAEIGDALNDFSHDRFLLF